MRVIVLLRYSFCGTLTWQGLVTDTEIGWRDSAWPTISCDDIPRSRIERYEPQREKQGRFGGVKEGSERHVCNAVAEASSANIYDAG